ncbi:MAG: family 43 glycosylhydrolase [Bacillota bacterium]|nr:family 43 glycosylhydrolase [Bacillota bacterium]
MKVAQNPILRGFYPDPSICRVGRDYYLVNSTFAYVPGVPVFHSRDLVNWQQIGNVLERKSQLVLDGASMSRGIFAPSIRYHKGIFYMITTNVSYGGNFYVTADDPAGPWSDPVYLKVPEGVDGGIDPSLYFEGDKCYYVGQRQKKNARFYGDCEVWLQELDLAKGELVGKDYSLYDGAMKDACWVEGPHLYRIGEYYYITCAEMGTSFEHSICVARSKALTGPYENYKCNPLLTHRHLGRNYPIQNIGHGDLVDTPEGEWYLVMLGTRPLNGAAELGRETFLARVEWEEGWPVVNPGEGKVLWQQPAADISDQYGQNNQWSENAHPAFESRMEMKFSTPLDKRFMFFRHPDEDTFKATGERECALKCSKGRPEDTEGVISYLGLRQQDRSFRISVQVSGKLPVDAGAGLLYLYDDNNYIKLLIGRQEEELYVTISKREKGQDYMLFQRSLKSFSKDNDWMALEISGGEQRISFALWGEELPVKLSAGFMSAEQTGGFIGCTYGIYAEGTGQGYASFKDLTVEYGI